MALRRYIAAISMFIGAPVLAADMSISVEIPQLPVAEYHRPYVAFWLERDGAHAANLSVWYQLEKGEGGKKGEEWLKDMRQWWRRSGRTLEMPVDGISGATKAPGVHNLSFTPGQGVLADLPAGEYQLLVEAVREVGGRELLKIPFQWPPRKEETHSANGSSELGTLTLKLIP
jgi:hypothetical protein